MKLFKQKSSLRIRRKQPHNEAYDLKNPLTAILLLTEMIDKQLNVSADSFKPLMMKNLIKKTKFETLRLNHMVDGLIDTSNEVQAKKKNFEYYSLQEFLEQRKVDLEGEADLVFSTPELVFWDKLSIGTILRNFLLYRIESKPKEILKVNITSGGGIVYMKTLNPKNFYLKSCTLSKPFIKILNSHYGSYDKKNGIIQFPYKSQL